MAIHSGIPNPGHRARLRWPMVFGWVVVMAVAAWVRVWSLGSQVVIDDEWHALHTLFHNGYRDIFLSFGHADHSIPLTLWLRLLADVAVLNEWTLRLLPLVFGLVTVIAVPRALRAWMDGRERLLLAGLLAISPLLIYFSRQARPYAISGLLVLGVLVGLQKLWSSGRKRWAGGTVLAAVAAAWLHPLTLAFTGPALLWFIGRSLLRGRRNGDWLPLWKFLVTAGLIAAGCAVLLAGPLINDFASLAVKAGIHRVEPVTLLVAWQLFAGTGYWPVALILGALAIHGIVLLVKRDGSFAAYLGFVALGAAALISVLNAAWIHHGLVLARYLGVLQFLLLAAVAISLAAIGRWLMRRWAPPEAMVAAAGGLLALLVWQGPLPAIMQSPNAFTGHLVYQFDYNRKRNAFRQHLELMRIPSFYQRIGEARGDGAVLEAGWHFESHRNPLVRYQPVHGRPVMIGLTTGLCSDWIPGEVPRDRPGIRFATFRHLDGLLADPRGIDFLVFHIEPRVTNPRELPDPQECIDYFRSRLGEPWLESEGGVIFDLRGLEPAASAGSR